MSLASLTAGKFRADRRWSGIQSLSRWLCTLGNNWKHFSAFKNRNHGQNECLFTWNIQPWWLFQKCYGCYKWSQSSIEGCVSHQGCGGSSWFGLTMWAADLLLHSLLPPFPIKNDVWCFQWILPWHLTVAPHLIHFTVCVCDKYGSRILHRTSCHGFVFGHPTTAAYDGNLTPIGCSSLK